MDNIINRLYEYDEKLFINKIYEPLIKKLKIKLRIKIHSLKTCIWCHETFNYNVYGLCSDCNNYYNII